MDELERNVDVSRSRAKNTLLIYTDISCRGNATTTGNWNSVDDFQWAFQRMVVSIVLLGAL